MNNNNITQRIEERLQERQRKEQKMQAWEQKAHHSLRMRPLYIALAVAACVALAFILSPSSTSTPSVPTANETELFRGGDATIQHLVAAGAYEEAIQHVDSLIELQDREILGYILLEEDSEEVDYELHACQQKRHDLQALRKNIRKMMRK